MSDVDRLDYLVETSFPAPRLLRIAGWLAAVVIATGIPAFLFPTLSMIVITRFMLTLD